MLCRAFRDTTDFDNPGASEAIRMFIREGSFPVWLSHAGTKKLIFPDAALAQAILNPQGTVWQSLLPQALAWRKRLGLD